ncbi:MAG: hypothetical protein JW738_05830 [Actinobacteria bacterium]|nr:hypothetical protein [Actinomycetota bacterium]
MKRLIVLLSILALFTGLLAFLPGCGGNDTAKAKEYMQAGDNLNEEFITASEDMGDEITAIFSSMESGSAVSSSEAEDNYEKYNDDIEGLLDKANEAKKEYEKILDLNDAEDYKEYAKLGIEDLDLKIEILDKIGVLLDDYAVMLKDVESGVITDPAEVEAVMSDSSEELSGLFEKSDKLEKEIEDLKETKNL